MKTSHVGLALLVALCCATTFAEPDKAFSDFARRVKAFSGGMNAGNRAKVVVGDRACLDVAGESGRGLNLVVLDGEEPKLYERFDMYADPDASHRLYKTVADLPVGTYVVIVACDDASNQFTGEAATAIRELGGKYSLAGRFRWSYLLIGRKGLTPGDAIEKIGPTSLSHNVSVEEVLAEPVPTD